MAGYFVTPTIDFRFDHEAGPMPRLIKREKLEGLLPQQSWWHIELDSCIERNKLERRTYFVSLDVRSFVGYGAGALKTRVLETAHNP